MTWLMVAFLIATALSTARFATENADASGGVDEGGAGGAPQTGDDDVSSEEVADDTPSGDDGTQDAPADTATEPDDAQVKADSELLRLGRGLIGRREPQGEADQTKPAAAETRPAEPEPFKVKIDPDKFEENPAQATAEALQSVYDALAAQSAEAAKANRQVQEMLESQGRRAEQSHVEQAITTMEKVRKELGAEFAEIFGNQPIRMMEKNSPAYKNLVALENEMVFLAQLLHMRGDEVPELNADFARRAMKVSERKEFKDALSRSTRRGLKSELNKMARGVTPKPSPRRDDKSNEDFDASEARKRAIEYAKRRERAEEAGTAATY